MLLYAKANLLINISSTHFKNTHFQTRHHLHQGPASRLSSKINAFTPYIRPWNSLSEPIRSAKTLSHFKTLLNKSTTISTHFLPKLYKYTIGKSAISHSRLRLGLSALQFHIFKYNLINDMSCPSCLHPKEDTKHFIFFVRLMRLSVFHC